MSTDPRLLLLQPLMRSYYPVKVGGVEFTSVQLFCRRCNAVLAADKVHGKEQASATKNVYREFQMIGACPACKVLTTAQVRFHADKTLQFLTAADTWTIKAAT